MMIWKGIQNSPLLRYASSLLAIAASFLLYEWLGYITEGDLPPYITFYPAVVLVSFLTGFWAGALSTMAAALLTAYWILPPHSSLMISSFSDLVSLILFILNGLFMSLAVDLYHRVHHARGDQMEEALREKETLLQSVFKASPVGLCIVRDRVFQHANEAFYGFFGYTESEIVGCTPRKLYPDDEEYERVGRILYPASRGNLVSCAQTTHLRKDGTVRDVILRAAPLFSADPSRGTVVAVEDITDYRRAIEDSEQNRKQLASIIDFLPDATLVIDKDRRVLAWNRAMEEMTGVSAKEMLDKGNYEYAIPFCGARRPMLIDLAFRPDPELERQFTSFQRKGDVLFGESYTSELGPERRYLYAAASVLRDSKGEIVAAIECIRDRTEHKRFEAALRESEERLQRAQKMESLGVLAGGVAHDLNNILGVMMGYSELMLYHLDKDDALRGHVNNIMKSSGRAAAIVQDMLTIARRGVVTREPENLNTIIREQLETPEYLKLRTYHPRVKVKVELDPDLPNISGSSVHLGKSLMNLLSNAAEAIQGDGTVIIRTRHQYLDRPVHGYDDVKEGDYAVLSVSDSGEGISPEDMKRIFEPFYTKKIMGRSGTGLGLSVIWGTVKDHEGYVDVESKPGLGTVFTLFFPVTRETKTEKHAVVPTAYIGKGETILVVDDLEEQRELATKMLTRLNYRVATVPGGEEALAYLRERNADLIVLDMIMDPGIDGLETYRRVIEISPGQKTIIVSGYAETERVKKAQELGAGPFVRKPYILEKIGLAIRRELDKDRHWTESVKGV